MFAGPRAGAPSLTMYGSTWENLKVPAIDEDHECVSLKHNLELLDVLRSGWLFLLFFVYCLAMFHPELCSCADFKAKVDFFFFNPCFYFGNQEFEFYFSWSFKCSCPMERIIIPFLFTIKKIKPSERYRHNKFKKSLVLCGVFSFCVPGNVGFASPLITCLLFPGSAPDQGITTWAWFHCCSKEDILNLENLFLLPTKLLHVYSKD